MRGPKAVWFHLTPRRPPHPARDVPENSKVKFLVVEGWDLGKEEERQGEAGDKVGAQRGSW